MEIQSIKNEITSFRSDKLMLKVVGSDLKRVIQTAPLVSILLNKNWEDLNLKQRQWSLKTEETLKKSGFSIPCMQRVTNGEEGRGRLEE